MQENTFDIILVEDNPRDVEMTLEALQERKFGNRVHVLKDGAEAVSYILDNVDCRPGKQGEQRPKLIILDLKLPKLNGLEVLRRIRSDERTKCVPVVILTSSNEERDRIAGYNLGVNSYVVKPVNFDDFTKAVAEIGCYWVLTNKPPY